MSFFCRCTTRKSSRTQLCTTQQHKYTLPCLPKASIFLTLFYLSYSIISSPCVCLVHCLNFLLPSPLLCFITVHTYMLLFKAYLHWLLCLSGNLHHQQHWYSAILTFERNNGITKAWSNLCMCNLPQRLNVANIQGMTKNSKLQVFKVTRRRWGFLRLFIVFGFWCHDSGLWTKPAQSNHLSICQAVNQSNPHSTRVIAWVFFKPLNPIGQAHMALTKHGILHIQRTFNDCVYCPTWFIYPLHINDFFPLQLLPQWQSRLCDLINTVCNFHLMM